MAWILEVQVEEITSGLNKDSAAKQMSTLQYCLGQEAESVLSPTNTTQDD